MSRRLQHAEDTIRTALDPLGHFIHTLEEDIKIFERKSEVVMGKCLLTVVLVFADCIPFHD